MNECVRRMKPAAALALIACAACGEDGGGVARATFRDSAGVRIAENPSPDDSAALVWWRLEGPELDVGGEGVAEEYALFRISGALRLEDGRFVVANGGSSDLRYYDAEGRHLATVGRRGAGPGEFRSVALLLRGPGDSVQVYDAQARRFSVIGPEPAFVRDYVFEDPSAVSIVLGRTTSGAFVGLPFGLRGPPDELPQGLTRMDQVVVQFSASGELVDTIGQFPGPERVIHIREQSGEIVSIEIRPPHFARTPSFALSDDELWVGTQDEAVIERYTLDGTLVQRIHTGRSPVAVTPAHLSAVIERSLENAAPERHAEIRRALEAIPHGAFVPPYGSFMVDAAGNLWVSDYADPLVRAGRWTVYGGDGGVRARIALPPRFRPFEIGEDWVLGRELDDLDVEHLRLYRIVR